MHYLSVLRPTMRLQAPDNRTSDFKEGKIEGKVAGCESLSLRSNKHRKADQLGNASQLWVGETIKLKAMHIRAV